MMAPDLVELKAYFSLEPTGEIVTDIRFGRLMSLLANVHRKKGSKRFREEEFQMCEIGSLRGVSKKQPWRNMLETMTDIASKVNKRLSGKKDKE